MASPYVLALLTSGLLATPAVATEPETIVFPSQDGLPITADLYLAHDDAETPFIVLFHQAGWSRGEYREIAPRLNDLGFNCLAVDQRSGDSINDVTNETAAAAEAADLETTYVDALPDVVAALVYARAHLAEGPILAWGSSYSAALVLKVAGDEPDLVDGVLAFAPGEYFVRLGKPGDWIAAAAAAVECPVFITSAKNEEAAWTPLFEAIPHDRKASFLPETKGQHGSRALWKLFPESEAYWKAVEGFLAEHVAGD